MTTVVSNQLDAVISQFRQYDQGVVDFLNEGLPIKQDGKGVPVVMASPDRAFAAMQHLLGVDDIKNIPLPFISIVRTRVQHDPVRFHGPQTFFRKIATSRGGEFTYNARFPLPYDITYQIEFWAKNRETLNALELWMACQFVNGFETFITIDFTEVWPSWKTKKIPFENEGIQDNSDLEPQGEHRVLRFTQQLTAKSWILGTIEEVKAVHTIFQDLYLTDTTTVLPGVTGGDVDADPATFRKACRVTTDDQLSTTTQNF